MTLQRAWAVFSVWDGEGHFVEVFSDKGEAQRRVARLLDGCPWRRPEDYQLRRAYVPLKRCFDR